MLERLIVRGLGVIEELTVEFGPAMTVITGETGAGKTLLVEALQLALGGRADPSLVREGSDRAVVEAVFVVDGTRVTLGREIPRQGRTKALIDHQVVTASDLVGYGGTLMDIHGQHDAQSLFSTHAARDLLDHFAHLDGEPLAVLRRECARIDRALADLGGDPAERLRREDLLTFQLNEIDQANLSDPDEERSLEETASLLEHADVIAAHLDTARDLLDGNDETAVLNGLQGVVGALSGADFTADLEVRARDLVALAGELSSDIRNRGEGIEADPERLSAITDRRRLLYDLKRKYGPTLDDVIAFAHTCREELEGLANSDTRRNELVQARSRIEADIATAALALGDARRAAAPSLSEEVTATLQTLALAHATFEVVVSDDDAGDEVVCYFSANPGQRPQPLIRVASGGELARTMLALRLAAPEGPSSMVFDEVDAGVGGQAARALADALSKLGRNRQVLVVTHLPQVAAAAHDHFVIDKAIRGAVTTTTLRRVTGEERVTELARMLSGQPDSDVARAHGRELLAQSDNRDVSHLWTSEVV